MNNKKVAGVAATTPATELESGCQPSFPMPILPKIPVDVKVLYDLKTRNVPNRDVVEAVRTIYPACESPLLSKCRNYAQYGIGLRQPAVTLLREHFKLTPPGTSTRARRTKPNRIQCRLSDELYGLLQRRLVLSGKNTQDYLEALILTDLQTHAKELRK